MAYSPGVLGIGEDGRTISEDPDSKSSSQNAGPTVAQNLCASSSSASSSPLTSSTIGLERDELEAEHKHVTDRLLRSELCRQPAGTDRADNRIVEHVMRVVEIESANVPGAAEQAATNISELACRPTPMRLASG